MPVECHTIANSEDFRIKLGPQELVYDQSAIRIGCETKLSCEPWRHQTRGIDHKVEILG